MKKYTFLFIILVGLTYCQNHIEEETTITVKKDKDKAINYWKKAKSGLQFSDYHRLHFDSAFLYYPDTSDISQVYSYSYKKTGEHIKAMQLLNKAVEVDSKEVLGYRAWSMLYYYRHYEKTIADIDTLLKLTNACMEVCWGEPCKYHRFLALYKLEKYEAALEEIAELKQCEQAYGFNVADNYNYNFYIARCYHKLKNHDIALQYYDRLLVKEGGILAEYLYYKALVQIDLEEKEIACTLFQEALEQAHKGNTFSDPYVELFDKVYVWMITDKMEENCPKS